MSNAEIKEFSQVANIINNMIKTTDTICESLWQEHCEKCPFWEGAVRGDVIKCGYPEQINYINVDNCVYYRCPLIKGQGGHDV